jgi:hypothetical protein
MEGWGCSSLGKHLLNMCKALGSFPQNHTHKKMDFINILFVMISILYAQMWTHNLKNNKHLCMP